MLERTTDILRDLIAFPTVSADNNLDMIDYMAGLLEDAGARVELIHAPGGTKANLFATLGPDTDGGIVLSGHSDVVPVTDQDWSSDPFQMAERDDRLYGRGTCDMKGFIAATLACAPRFADSVTDRPLHFSFTYDEETGCLGARHLAEVLTEKGLSPSVAIIGEPTDMRIIEGHKGCYEYTTHFTGLPGHGSLPDKGVNAVEYAVRYVTHLLGLKDHLRARVPQESRFDPPWTTVNIGAINGGVAHNVIAPTAQVDWEMRPVQISDADYVKNSLNAFCETELLPQMRAVSSDASILTEVIGEVAGLIPTNNNEALRIIAELTGANGSDVVSFGTEAGIFQSLGMDVVVCGPGSIEQAHKANEFLSLDQLTQCLTMLDRFAHRLAKGRG
jgi:acetylornithine deacetylase